MHHRTMAELEAELARIHASPRRRGRLEAIVVRPERDARRELESCRVDPVGGLEGDRWVKDFSSPPLPGMPEQDSQVAIMNARVAAAVAGSRGRWALAGDQLYVDLDLSEEHLRPGDRLRIGPVAEFEVTPEPHLGCRKFAARYGEAALSWVNSPEGRRWHYRGIYLRVVVPGEIRAGDVIEVRTPERAGGPRSPAGP